MLRIIISNRKTHMERAPTFDATLESTGEFLCRSSTPFLAGARRLIELGFDPEELVVMRHKDKLFDSFKPAKLGKIAELRVLEKQGGFSRDRFGLHSYKKPA